MTISSRLIGRLARSPASSVADQPDVASGGFTIKAGFHQHLVSGQSVGKSNDTNGYDHTCGGVFIGTLDGETTEGAYPVGFTFSDSNIISVDSLHWIGANGTSTNGTFYVYLRVDPQVNLNSGWNTCVIDNNGTEHTFSRSAMTYTYMAECGGERYRRWATTGGVDDPFDGGEVGGDFSVKWT